MELTAGDLTLRQRYRLLIGCIVPRPIALVSTLSSEGVPNLAPYSFFNGVGSDPMTLLFCPANGPDGSEKDTLRNCRPRDEGGTGEFVVNVALEPYRRQMAAAAEPLPYGESELELTGLATAPSRVVAPPRLADSPVAFECRTLQVIRTNPGAAAGGNIVLGEIVHLYVSDDLVDDDLRVDPARLPAIGRLGGLSYCRIGGRFGMPRGRAALEQPEPNRTEP